MKKFFFAALFAFTAGFASAQSTWSVDNSHSKLGFKVAHLKITETEGYFKTYSGTVKSKSDDFNNAEVEFTADATTINTESEMRDNHLRTDEFFGVEKFPKIAFKSTSFKKVKGNDYVLKGNLTIKDVTKPVTLNVKYNGTVTDPYGNTKAGFKFNGTINRVDFKVGTPGGTVIGEEVELTGSIELGKNKS